MKKVLHGQYVCYALLINITVDGCTKFMAKKYPRREASGNNDKSDKLINADRHRG